MQFRVALWVAVLCASGFVAMRPTPESDAERAERSDQEAATHRFIAHVLVPVWMLPGVGDYLCHRSSHIERTSGTHESLTHMLMISSTGIGVLTGLFFEINDSALVVMAASALFHEAVVLWDVSYAQRLRPPSAVEQHMHSFLEVLPFTALAGMCCLHPEAAKTLFSPRALKSGFRLKPKRNKESPSYLAAVLVMGTVALALPYAEEFIRCFKIDRSLLPRG